MILRYAALVVALATVLGVATACGDGGSGGTPPATATAPGETATPSPGTTPAANESGQEPIVWRTEDDFASLQAGKAYKVLFRITNGYAEPSLTVTATCQSCAPPSERQPIEFEGQRTDPVGGDAPGSYYPMNIELPYAGQWEIVIVAGDDTAQIDVSAASGPASG